MQWVRLNGGVAVGGAFSGGLETSAAGGQQPTAHALARLSPARVGVSEGTTRTQQVGHQVGLVVVVVDDVENQVLLGLSLLQVEIVVSPNCRGHRG